MYITARFFLSFDVLNFPVEPIIRCKVLNVMFLLAVLGFLEFDWLIVSKEILRSYWAFSSWLFLLSDLSFCFPFANL